MSHGSYLKNSEDKLSEVSASYKKEWGEKENGQLICTNSRVIFFNNSDIIDINTGSIDSMEYALSSFDRSTFVWGVLLLLFGGVVAIAGPMIGETGLDGTGIILASLLGLIGLGMIGWSLINRKETLEVHTPKKSFTFVSKGKDLLSIAESTRE
jgi:hypothetical protein